MSAACEVAGPNSDIGRLFQDLTDTGNVQLRVDSNDGVFIVWLASKIIPRVGCHSETWWTLGTESWTMMGQFAAVKRLRFIREPDRHAPGREVLTIRFVGTNGVSTLRADLTPAYDEHDRPIAAQFARWEELRAKYGGQEE